MTLAVKLRNFLALVFVGGVVVVMILFALLQLGNDATHRHHVRHSSSRGQARAAAGPDALQPLPSSAARRSSASSAKQRDVPAPGRDSRRDGGEHQARARARDGDARDVSVSAAAAAAAEAAGAGPSPQESTRAPARDHREAPKKASSDGGSTGAGSAKADTRPGSHAAGEPTLRAESAADSSKGGATRMEGSEEGKHESEKKKNKAEVADPATAAGAADKGASPPKREESAAEATRAAERGRKEDKAVKPATEVKAAAMDEQQHVEAPSFECVEPTARIAENMQRYFFGMPKSGTTWLEFMMLDALREHFHVKGARLKELPRHDEIKALRNDPDLDDRLASAMGAMPKFDHVSQIENPKYAGNPREEVLEKLRRVERKRGKAGSASRPEARVLVLVRDPRDVLLSMFSWAKGPLTSFRYDGAQFRNIVEWYRTWGDVLKRKEKPRSGGSDELPGDFELLW